MKFADGQTCRSSLMHFHFAKYSHKKYKNALTLRNIGLYYSRVYINIQKCCNFLFIPRVNVDLQRLPAPSGFRKQIVVNPLVDIIGALWLLANMLTPAAGKKKNSSHVTQICYTIRFQCNHLHNSADTMEEAYANFSVHPFFHRRLGTQLFPSLKDISYFNLL